jgi:hypothetical protein
MNTNEEYFIREYSRQFDDLSLSITTQNLENCLEGSCIGKCGTPHLYNNFLNLARTSKFVVEVLA